MRLKMDAEKPNVQEAIEGRPVASWASTFIDYPDLKARLLAVESKEASGHFVGLLILVGVLLVLALSSVLMYGIFLLRMRLRKPVFQMTLMDLEKDKE
jgi:uncharacterized membrane protein YqjE